MRTPSPWPLCLVMLCAAAPLKAQDKPMNVGIGYQFLKFEDVSFPLGLNLDFAGGLTEHFAFVGEFGWSRDSARQFGLREITTALEAGGGIRWGRRGNGRFKPFGQILVGLERDTVDIEEFGSDSHWSSLVQPGGGIVIRVRNWQHLFGQVDLRRVFQKGDRANAVRFVIGLRFNIH